MDNEELRQLQTLAQLYQIETTYTDAAGNQKLATASALWDVLSALGAPLAKPSDLKTAILQRRLQIWQKSCPPVVVSWPGQNSFVELHLPEYQQHALMQIKLKLENGHVQRWETKCSDLTTLNINNAHGSYFLNKKLPLPTPLPRGYHQLHLQWANQSRQILVLAPPGRAYNAGINTQTKSWGIFLPLYALRSNTSWAAGDMADLKRLSNWVQQLGGSFVGTLPLLAAYFDTPFAPSPYSPASRLFWNEFYLDLNQIPELKLCSPALELLNHRTMQKIRANLNQQPLVCYRRGMASKRSVLELLARYHLRHINHNDVQQQQFQKWLQKNPRAKDYASFRATMERQKKHWQQWPARMRQGLLQDGDFDPLVAHYHLYVQWLIHKQLQEQNKNSGLYLDLPLGVHSAGYDTWREQNIFVAGASCGAPPDPLNQQGQNWDLAPLHPEQIRQQGYRYFLDVLRHHLSCCQMLRIDHVMGLHRMYWIPQGHSARDGVYVKYQADEFYALLALESNRHRVRLIGEDLGTVPGQVRRAMDKHGLNRMYILPFETGSTPRQGVNDVPTATLAALNTHDMPPFAAAWETLCKARQLTLITRLAGSKQKKNRVYSTQAVLEASLKFLASSPANFLLINLEDLWLEKKPQNIPGTTSSYPNWRRKARLDWENFSSHSKILNILRQINALRKYKVYQPK